MYLYYDGMYYFVEPTNTNDFAFTGKAIKGGETYVMDIQNNNINYLRTQTINNKHVEYDDSYEIRNHFGNLWIQSVNDNKDINERKRWYAHIITAPMYIISLWTKELPTDAVYKIVQDNGNYITYYPDKQTYLNKHPQG